MARTPWVHKGSFTWIVIASLVALLGIPAQASESPCPDGAAIVLPSGVIACTHGPDPEPEVVSSAAPNPSTLSLAANPTVTCIDDGQSGNRVQALYVVASDRPDRRETVVPEIRRSIEAVDTIFSASSTAAGGSDMTVRWVHDSECVADVQTVVVPPNADDTFAATIDALADAGYDEPGRHYLAWVDATVYCGIAVAFGDDRAGQENVNNGTHALWARVDRDCWGRDGLVEAHELTHMLGAVQASAPNATTNGHCTDDYDVMCYKDGPATQMTVACPDPRLELRLDCNGDDYFHPNPPDGSYLDTHWNVARSAFLHTGPAPAPTPAPPSQPETGNPFSDVGDGNVFAADIAWLRDSGITAGCNPPANDRFCPDDPVTRGQMAAFLSRALELPDGSGNTFTDDDSTPFQSDIERLAGAGITSGCTADRFCPDAPVTRGQMAAFLSRALGLPGGAGDTFTDDDSTPFQSDIERLAGAGITTGCGGDRFCPEDSITRGQMAAFLRRALSR